MTRERDRPASPALGRIPATSRVVVCFRLWETVPVVNECAWGFERLLEEGCRVLISMVEVEATRAAAPGSNVPDGDGPGPCSACERSSPICIPPAGELVHRDRQ